MYIELLLNEINILITSFYRKINHINKRRSFLVVHISYKHQVGLLEAFLFIFIVNKFISSLPCRQMREKIAQRPCLPR